jgi:hypothetical protein
MYIPHGIQQHRFNSKKKYIKKARVVQWLEH